MVLTYLIEKEFRQMVRNRVLPIVFAVLPVVMMGVLPWIATQEVKNLTVTVVNNDGGALSQRMVQRMEASDCFRLASVEGAYEQALAAAEAGGVDFICEIKPDFERSLLGGGEAHVMISACTVNGVKAGLGMTYLGQIVQQCGQDVREEMGTAAQTEQGGRMRVQSRYLYNPELDYRSYMIPGLMSMLLVLLVGFLPALNIVGEKERGTIEQMNVTPVSRMDFILSKLMPYWLVGLGLLGYCMLLAGWFYGLWPASGAGSVFLFASVFVLVVSALGLIVSALSDTARQAALVMFFFLIVFILLSGLLTPVGSMPEWAKLLTRLNPLRYFIEAMRALYLKGSSIVDLLPQMSALAGGAVAFGALAVRCYRKEG